MWEQSSLWDLYKGVPWDKNHAVYRLREQKEADEWKAMFTAFADLSTPEELEQAVGGKGEGKNWAHALKTWKKSYRLVIAPIMAQIVDKYLISVNLHPRNTLMRIAKRDAKVRQKKGKATASVLQMDTSKEMWGEVWKLDAVRGEAVNLSAHVFGQDVLDNDEQLWKGIEKQLGQLLVLTGERLRKERARAELNVQAVREEAQKAVAGECKTPRVKARNSSL